MKASTEYDQPTYEWAHFLAYVAGRASNTSIATDEDLCAAFALDDERFRAGSQRLMVTALSEQVEDRYGVHIREVALMLGSRLEGRVSCACALTAERQGDGRVTRLYILPESQGEAAERRFYLAAASLDDVHVFVAPLREDALKKDAWWDAGYARCAQVSGSCAYSAYRDTIDRLILAAFGELLPAAAGAAAAGDDDADGDAGGGDCSGGGGGEPLVVCELCGGDGSLGAALLAAHGPEAVGSYTLLERNAALATQAAATLGADARAAIVRLDVCSAAGQAAIGAASPRPHVWVASGSTLNGQVGAAGMAAPTLARMAAALRPGGFVLVTGFSGCHLTPRAIAAAGLRVRRASLPSAQADGLGGEGGRFVFFVLQKPQVDGGGGGGDEGDEAVGPCSQAFTRPALAVCSERPGACIFIFVYTRISMTMSSL